MALGSLQDNDQNSFFLDIAGKTTRRVNSFSLEEIDGYMLNGQAFSASMTAFLSVSGISETPLYLLRNPLLIFLLLHFFSLSFSADSNTARGIYRFYAQPTITANGTALTIGNNFIGHPTASVALASISPTISANGTFLAAFLLGTSQNTFIVRRSLVIPAGVNILATVQNSQNNTPVLINPVWREIVT